MQFEDGRVCFGFHFGGAVHHGRANIVERMDLAMAAGMEAAGDAASTAGKQREMNAALYSSIQSRTQVLDDAAYVQDESSLLS